MRRYGAILLLAAAIPAAAVFAPLLAGENAAQCAMACHKGATEPGATCCPLGGEPGAALASCPESHDGVPQAPACRMFPPRPSAVLLPPSLAEPATSAGRSARIFRPSEPPDPVPLALS